MKALLKENGSNRVCNLIFSDELGYTVNKDGKLLYLPADGIDLLITGKNAGNVGTKPYDSLDVWAKIILHHCERLKTPVAESIMLIHKLFAKSDAKLFESPSTMVGLVSWLTQRFSITEAEAIQVLGQAWPKELSLLETIEF